MGCYAATTRNCSSSQFSSRRYDDNLIAKKVGKVQAFGKSGRVKSASFCIPLRLTGSTAVVLLAQPAVGACSVERRWLLLAVTRGGAGVRKERPWTECCHLPCLVAKSDPVRLSETLPLDRHLKDIDFILKVL